MPGLVLPTRAVFLGGNFILHMDLEPRHLRYFIAVAEALNFGRAATNLHLSQPSLSVAIKNLESIYGIKLLNRHSRHVELTEAGYRFLPVARRTIAELDSAATFLRSVARGEPEVFRIGYSPFLDMQLVGCIRLEFTCTNGGVPTILVGCPTAVQIKALQRSELDAGLLVTAWAPLLKSERLSREPLRVARNADTFSTHTCGPLRVDTSSFYLPLMIG